MISKKYIAIGVLAIGGLFFVGLGTVAFVSQAAGVNERVIVTFEHGVSEKAIGALENKGGHVLKELPIVNGAVVFIPEQAISALSSIAGVKSVEKDIRVFALKPPGGCEPWPECKNDGGEETPVQPVQPAETIEWGVDRIDADLAWGTSRGTGVRVAIIDTGIDRDHEDLVANIKGGINFVLPQVGPPPKRVVDPNKWDDDNGHGTHVAGIVAAVDNEVGVVGVAPEAHLFAVKVLDSSGSGYLSDVVSGIEWAVNNQMDVINMSLGASTDSQVLRSAVDAAHTAGVILVAAAGNSGDGNGDTNDINYPAKYSSVIAVGATDLKDISPAWSSEGEELEISAPGVDIHSTWNDGLYKTISGTSMAAPHVTGVVALMLAGAWNPIDVRTALQSTADDLGTDGHDNFYGYGLVDAEESVTGTQTN